MKRFLAIYLGSAAAMAKWSSLPEHELRELQAAGGRAWNEWVDRNKDSIVDTGSPLGRTKNVSTAGVLDVKNDMAAFTVVQAESHEAAAKLFKNHPHFTVFPGAGVEIMECLPIPSM